MIIYKTSEEIETMAAGGTHLAKILQKLAAEVRPGVSADTLEQIAQAEIKKVGATPAFLNYDTGYMGEYPAALCISRNDEVVHGLPSPDKVFQQGDLIGIDCGIWFNGLCVDSAITVPCGRVSADAQKLVTVAGQALTIGIAKCRVGNHVGDIGAAVQKYVEAQGFCVIKSLVGHGVGKRVHEEPQIPNFFPFDPHNPKNRGARIKERMTLAIEPMISIGAETTKRGKDGYAATTVDSSLAAHFEHTVAVTKSGPRILTQDS